MTVEPVDEQRLNRAYWAVHRHPLATRELRRKLRLFSHAQLVSAWRDLDRRRDERQYRPLKWPAHLRGQQELFRQGGSSHG